MARQDAVSEHKRRRRVSAAYYRALTRRTDLQSEKLALAVAQQQGRLVDQQIVADLWSATCQALKSRLRLLPTRLADAGGRNAPRKNSGGAAAGD